MATRPPGYSIGGSGPMHVKPARAATRSLGTLPIVVRSSSRDGRRRETIASATSRSARVASPRPRASAPSQ